VLERALLIGCTKPIAEGMAVSRKKRGQMIRMLMLMRALLVSKKVHNVKSALKSGNCQLSQETFEQVA
jgi:hypothetical protein